MIVGLTAASAVREACFSAHLPISFVAVPLRRTSPPKRFPTLGGLSFV